MYKYTELIFDKGVKPIHGDVRIAVSIDSVEIIGHHRYKCKMYNYKTLEDNIGENIYDLKLSKVFLDMTSKALIIKEKNDNLDFVKIKCFCSEKKICSDNESSSKLITKLSNLNSKGKKQFS